jgi:hypothetical protein
MLPRAAFPGGVAVITMQRKRFTQSPPAALSVGASDLLGPIEIVDPLDTIAGCNERATALYFEISRRHGSTAANQIFDHLGTLSKARKRRLDEAMLQSWFDIGNSQGWTDVETARRLIVWNKKGPKADRMATRIQKQPSSAKLTGSGKRLARKLEHVESRAVSQQSEHGQFSFKMSGHLHSKMFVVSSKIRKYSITIVNSDGVSCLFAQPDLARMNVAA